jgi:hypothetical protein
MDLTVIRRPSTEAILAFVTVQDVKTSERITHSREDSLIEDGILAAYDFLDGPDGWMNGYFILESEVELHVGSIGNVLEISARPIVNEQAVLFERRADDGSYVGVPASDFTMARQDGCVVLATLSRSAFATPTGGIVNPRAYRLTFLAGQADKEKVPASIRKAIILLASHYYTHREAAFADPRTGAVSREIEFGVKALCGRLRFHVDHS